MMEILTLQLNAQLAQILADLKEIREQATKNAETLENIAKTVVADYVKSEIV